MKKLIYFLLFFIAQILFSQRLPNFLLNDYDIFDKQHFVYDFQKHSVPQKEFIPVEKRNYDVLHYNLYMDWYYLLGREDASGSNTFDGINEIIFEVIEDMAKKFEFDFDSETIRIDSIYVDEKLHSNYQDNFNKLSIIFNDYLRKGDTIIVKIYYRYSSSGDEGLIFVDRGVPVDLGPPPENDTIYTEARLAYTMSQPVDARKWMPCNDYPYDKATAKISVRVPKGYSVASNGHIKDKIDDANSTLFVWESLHPIASYLMAVHSSEYAYFYDWYHRVTNPQDSIKMEYYVWESDFRDTSTDGKSYNAHYAFRNTVKMMEYFSKIFGEYPFEKYGQVVVQPAWFAGMEHQTITTLVRNLLRVYDFYGRNRDYSNQNVIAHEMAHQWLGDYLTCASWNDIWINEGGATWSEALWNGRDNLSVYYNNMLGKMNTFFWFDERTKQPSIYGPSIENVFNYATTYVKASIFYHMLSEALGREKFFELLQSMMSYYAYQSITTEDFKSYLKSQYVDVNSPVDFDKFFDQWIYKAGYPLFNVKVNSRTIVENERYDVELELNQMQNGEDFAETYEMPMWVTFISSDGSSKYDSIYVNQKLQKFYFSLPFFPEKVVFDTSKVLLKVNEVIVSVKPSKEDVTGVSDIFPNPSQRGDIVKLLVNVGCKDFVRIEVYNELGVRLNVIFSDILYPGNYEFEIGTSEFSIGNYFVKILKDDKLIVKKFVVIK